MIFLNRRTSNVTDRPALLGFVGYHGLALASWFFLMHVAGEARSQDARQENIQQELRVVWGGVKPVKAQGSISITDGSIELVRNLGVEKGANGAIRQKNRQTLQVSPVGESTFAGADIFVSGVESSLLRIQMAVSGAEEQLEFEVRLQELQDDTWLRTMGNTGSRIAIERQPHDRLRVLSGLESTIIEANSTRSLEVSGYRTGLPEGDYTLVAGWHEHRSGQPAASSTVRVDKSGSFPPIILEVKAPEKPGGYRLNLNLIKPSLLAYWTNTKPLLARSIDCLVLQQQWEPAAIVGWRPVLAVDPVTGIRSNSFGWLTSAALAPWPNRAIELRELAALSELSVSEQWGKLMTFSRAAPGAGSVERNGTVTARDFTSTAQDGQTQNQECVEIQAGSWLTLPLSGLQPNLPHRLRIEVPADRSGLLNITIQDPSNKEFHTLPVQSNLLVRELDVSSQGGALTHEFVFWPPSESIHVALSSGQRFQSASVGKILLEQAELSSESGLSKVGQPPQAAPGRSAGIYIDQPFLVDSLAATREKDPNNDRFFETWATWLAVAERLQQSVQLTGGNTLVLTVMADGGALFPIESLPTVPWLNKSTFFTDGRSPDGHDVVELLLRYFDQSGMQLILELDVSVSQLQWLPLQDDPTGVPEDFIQAGLDSASASDPRKNRESEGHRPVNPLHAQVQKQIIETVAEIAGRYAQHPSFSGISLRLHRESPLNFSGQRWGYNDTLIEQFAAQNGLNLPDTAEQRHRLFGSSAGLSFLVWRAEQLTRFYSQLSQTICELAPDAKLYLNTIRLWNRTYGDRSDLEAESAIRNPDQFLLGFGLDVASLSKIDGLILTQGSVRKGWTPQASKDWSWQSAAEQGVRLSGGIAEGALITHHPQARSLTAKGESIDVQFSESRKIYSDAVVHGSKARQILIDQLYRNDLQLLAFGGWYPIWNQEPSVAELLTTHTSLPPIVLVDRFPSLSDGPIRLRSGDYEDRTYYSVVNNSSFSIAIRLRLEQVAAAELELLGGRSSEDLSFKGGTITLRLKPFDFLAWSCRSGTNRVKSAEYELQDDSDEPKASLRLVEQLNRMENLLAIAGGPSAQRVLFQVGGTFENWVDSSRPVGWSVSMLPMTRIAKATELPHSGASCVVIENSNSESVAAWIQSSPIDLPRTGRLSLRAWLRSSAAASTQPVVRLGLVGRLKNGSRYQEQIYYGGAESGSRPLSNDWGRRPAELNISDVPVEDLVELKVTIDLVGPGKIWVDDVEVVETWLHPDERNYLRGQMLVAKQKLATNNPYPADKLLRSQWNEYLLSLEQSTEIVRTAEVQPVRRIEESSNNWNRQKSSIQQWRDEMLERWRR